MEQVVKSSNNKEIRKLGLQLGSIAGILTILYFLVLYFSGVKLFDDFSYKLDFWVTIPMIVVGIVYLRKLKKSLRIWEGLLLAFWIIIACSSLAALFSYAFLTFIEPEFIAESVKSRLAIIEITQSKITNPKRVEELKLIADNTAKYGESITPYSFAMDKIIWPYIIGSVVAFISSVLLRK